MNKQRLIELQKLARFAETALVDASKRGTKIASINDLATAYKLIEEVTKACLATEPG